MTSKASRRGLMCFDLVKIQLKCAGGEGVEEKNLGVCILKFILLQNKGHSNAESKYRNNLTLVILNIVGTS